LSEKEKMDLLIGLGLSPNQAKVYHTILKLGNVTVGLIAKTSSVRREDVYKVLPTLEKMGLVEKLLGKPATIRATPVAGALTSLILDEKVKSDERIASMKTKFQALAKVQWAKPTSLSEEESLYALIPEGKAVTAKIADLIATSKNSILWIDVLREISRIVSLTSNEIKRAIHTGTDVRLVIEDFKPDESQMKQVQHSMSITPATIRFNSQPLHRFAVFDGKTAMISTHRKNESEETSALWTTDSNLTGVLSSYFENAWNESKELK
jgi:sugar-specific transcriptional regulator TrmB